MSEEHKGQALVAAVREAPREADGWHALAAWARRGGRLGPDPGHQGLVLPLVRLLRRAPAERALVPALLLLLDAEHDAGSGPAPPFWERYSRVREAGDHRYDKETGLPLAICRRGDGARMLLVQQSSLKAGRGARSHLALPSRSFVAPLVYLDEERVSPAQVERADQDGHGLLQGWKARFALALGGRATGVPFEAAEAYASSLGMRLPREHELANAETRGKIRATYPQGMAGLHKEERRAAQAAWRRSHAALLGVASAYGIQLDEAEDAEPEWTGSTYGDYARYLPEGKRPDEASAARHLARSLRRLEAPGDEVHRCFRLAVTLDPIV